MIYHEDKPVLMLAALSASFSVALASYVSYIELFVVGSLGGFVFIILYPQPEDQTLRQQVLHILASAIFAAMLTDSFLNWLTRIEWLDGILTRVGAAFVLGVLASVLVKKSVLDMPESFGSMINRAKKKDSDKG